ncbi:hypothetical protein GCM10022199_08420 [Marihabitans asiaticum]|uniref:Uncharacterized protein DUF4446 n=1 Tax=Marihabitans asiaticum TaxID=415218 RepID=A0A560WH30_9MICO|nr:DUF4446 family protein [Marihabitans asiaticum]TWD16870.1 uncharacterized protein DUF4446 [Marihabitans asiaticum]
MEPLTVVAVVVAALALLLALVLLRQTSVLRARLAEVERTAPVGEAESATLRSEVGAALSRVAVVRYDAFGDMGGRLSFSAALLDANGDGIVLTSIHGRSESRTYAKGVTAGDSPDAAATLTPEERQAVAAARKGSASA